MWKFFLVYPLLAAGDWVNERAFREIRIRDSGLVETVTQFNIVPGPLKDYKPYTFFVHDFSSVGDFSVLVDGTKIDEPKQVALKDNIATFAVLLPNFDKKFEVIVSTVSGGLLKPLPAAIEELEKQFVLLETHLFIQSPHAVKAEISEIALSTGAQLENISHMHSIEVKEGKLILTPPSKNFQSPEHKNELLRVHFMHPFAMPFIEQVSKTIEVSHLGAAVSILEQIELVNGAAKLKGEFNRVPFTHMKFASSSSPSPFAIDTALMDVGAIIPFDAVNIHYRDVIGNVSTSAARRIKDEHVQFTYVSLSPRFPLLGGWKTEFEFSYDLPSSIFQTEDTFFVVAVPISHAIPSLLARDQKMTIILPAGAFDISVSTKHAIEISDSAGWMESSLLPWAPKKKIEFSLGTSFVHPDFCLSNLLYVKYRVAPLAIYKAPFLLSLYVFLLIVGILFSRRLSFRISNPEEAKLADQLNYDYDVCKEIEDSLTNLKTMNGELLQLTSNGKLDKDLLIKSKSEYLESHKAIQDSVEKQCGKFLSEKNKLDRTVRILMNLKTQKDAAIAHIDAVLSRKDAVNSAAKLIEAEQQISSLVGRVLTGEASPPPSPGGTPPSRGSGSLKSSPESRKKK